MNPNQTTLSFDLATKPDVSVTSVVCAGKTYPIPFGWQIVPTGALTALGDKFLVEEGFRNMSSMTIIGCPRVLSGEIVIRHPHRFYVCNLQGLPALSINQPWAWCIVRPDIAGPMPREKALAAGLIKPVENRDWNLRNPGRKFRGRFLIHASKGTGPTPKGLQEFKESSESAHDMAGTILPIPPLDKIDRGGIIGVATVTDFVDDHDSGWFVGPDALLLADSFPLPFTPCTGMLGFFKPTFPEIFTKEPAQ